MTSITIEGIKIIPIHLNIIFLDEFISVHSSLDEKKMQDILMEVDSSPTILDFNRIGTTVRSSTIEKLSKHIEKKQVRIINLNKYIFDQLVACSKDLVSEPAESDQYFIHTKQYPMHQNEKITAFLKRDSYLVNEIISACNNNIIDGIRKIASNVYTNKFFDISKLFANNLIVRMVVYLLAMKIEKMSSENIKLISSSINGGILATILGILFDYEHIGIPHLGSEIAVEDNRYLYLIERNDRLIYIYDFIALGNEQRMVYTIARLTSAKIIASIGLTFFNKYNDNTDCIIPFTDILNDIHFVATLEDMEFLQNKGNINDTNI